MGSRRCKNRRRRVQRKREQAAQDRRSKLKRGFLVVSCFFTRWRRGWVCAAACFTLFFLAQISQVLHEIYKEWRSKKNEYQLAVVLHAEYHGRGTLEVKLADSEEASPKKVDLAIYWQIFNSGLKPIQIVEYGVEIRSGHQWLRFRPISLWHPRYLVRRTQSKPDPVSIDVSSKYFDQLIRAKTLLPGNSIDGWVFLELDAAGIHQFYLEQIRVRISDIERRVYVVNPRLISKEQFNELSDKTSRKVNPHFEAVRNKQ